MNKKLDPKKWKAMKEKNKKALPKNEEAPKKESSGDINFDLTIRKLLKKK